jgi:hypothetical protein
MQKQAHFFVYWSCLDPSFFAVRHWAFDFDRAHPVPVAKVIAVLDVPETEQFKFSNYTQYKAVPASWHRELHELHC